MAGRTDGRSGRFYRDPAWGVSPLTDSEEWPSVTTILGAISKPALVEWAARMERNLCLETAAALYEDLCKLPTHVSSAAYRMTLATRLGQTRAHARASDKAKDVGTQCHKLIEWALRKAMGQTLPEPKASDAALVAFMAFQDWLTAHRVRPLAIEQTVYHPRLGYAGTLDLVAEVDGRIAVIDFKTSKAIYGEHHLQNVAYQDALIELGHWRADVGYIVRVPKSLEEVTGAEPCEVAQSPARLELLPYFRALLRVWLWWWREEERSRAEWRAKRKGGA